MTTLSDANTLDSHGGYYTDWKGHLLTAGGTSAPNISAAAKVGDGLIPPLAQGVQAGGTDSFGTTFGRVIGFDQFAASAEATAVAGPLTGGALMPIIFPVNIVDCDTNGDLGSGRDNFWKISEPGNPPVGQEYIVPMCKTGGGSFMVLDLDGVSNNCDAEVANPPKITFAKFPATVASDNGNNCAKPMVDEVNKRHGEIVLIPICDDACVTSNGSAAEYHITKVAAFWLDYMADQDASTHNPDCQGNGTTLKTIAGNGSSSCLVGYFIRYITTGSVGEGPITGASAAGVQLIR